MRRFKVYTRNVGESRWREAARCWTRNGAEVWICGVCQKIAKREDWER